MVIGLPVLSSSDFHLPSGELASCAEAANATEASTPARMILRMCISPPRGVAGRDAPDGGFIPPSAHVWNALVRAGSGGRRVAGILTEGRPAFARRPAGRS